MSNQQDLSQPLTSAQRDHLQQLASKLGMPVANRHIFLCCDQTNPKCCPKEVGLEAWDYLKARLKELNLSEQGGVQRSKSNCLRLCEQGPIAVVYPEGAWYAHCTKEVIEKIIQQHLIAGAVVTEHLVCQHALGEDQSASQA